MKKMMYPNPRGIVFCCFLIYRRRGKKKRSVSPDPYAHLVKEVPFNQPIEAPPDLAPPSRTVKSSLPNTLSGARRDLLESERLDVIARYRQLMGRSWYPGIQLETICKSMLHRAITYRGHQCKSRLVISMWNHVRTIHKNEWRRSFHSTVILNLDLKLHRYRLTRHISGMLW